MTQRSRLKSPPHLSALFLPRWRDAGVRPGKLSDADDNANPYEDAVYWELFENADRIDHCSVTALHTDAARRHLRAWAGDAVEAPVPSPIADARKAVRAVALAPQATTVGWERDATEAIGVGVFVALTKDADPAETLALTGRAFALDDAIVEEAQAFTRAHAALRPISVGRFFGRAGGAALRVIFHTGGDASWWRALPPTDAAVLEQLYAALPSESVANVAVTFASDRPHFALEARASETLGIDDAWQRWAGEAFPTRTPQQARLLARLHAKPTLQPERWPTPIALEAIRRGPNALPHIDTVYSHVKLQLGDDGAIHRKLYLLSRVQWSGASAD